jgi:hypothetical protein
VNIYRETERQRDGETERRRDRETERQRDRETERQRDRETERQRDRETERQRDRENYGHKKFYNVRPEDQKITKASLLPSVLLNLLSLLLKI